MKPSLAKKEFLMKRTIIYLLTLSFLILPAQLLAEVFGKMRYEDISDRQDIRTMIPRQENEAILVVVSRVPNLRFDSSNNIMEKRETYQSDLFLCDNIRYNAAYIFRFLIYS